jgi:hypothetical protein
VNSKNKNSIKSRQSSRNSKKLKQSKLSADKVNFNFTFDKNAQKQLKNLKRESKEQRINLKTLESFLIIHQIKFYKNDFEYIFKDIGGVSHHIKFDNFSRFLNSNVWDN